MVHKVFRGNPSPKKDPPPTAHEAQAGTKSRVLTSMKFRVRVRVRVRVRMVVLVNSTYLCGKYFTIWA